MKKLRSEIIEIGMYKRKENPINGKT